MIKSGIIIFLSFIFSCTYLSVEELTVDCEADPIILTISSVNSDCGLDNGEVSIEVSGGEAPFIFELSGTIQNDGFFTGLAPGNYTITVTASNNCIREESFSIFNNDGVQASATSTLSGCGTTAASLSVTAIEGISPYQYSLNGGAFQSGNVFENLDAGLQTVLVIDQNGCEFTLEQAILTGISYAQEVGPIIMNNCSVTGCHDGTQSPDFRNFSNVKANVANIRTNTQSGSMPADGRTITQAEIDAIACWIDDGALDN